MCIVITVVARLIRTLWAVVRTLLTLAIRTAFTIGALAFALIGTTFTIRTRLALIGTLILTIRMLSFVLIETLRAFAIRTLLALAIRTLAFAIGAWLIGTLRAFYPLVTGCATLAGETGTGLAFIASCTSEAGTTFGLLFAFGAAFRSIIGCVFNEGLFFFC